jgi:acyl dehydratase
MVSLEGSSGSRGAEETPPPAEPESEPATWEQVYFDDIEVAAALPTLVKEITLFTILKWGAAVNDYGPHHYDYKFATEFLGLPNVIAHGPHNTAHLAQLVTNWIGGRGTLKRHYAEMRGNVFPGDRLTFQGRVTEKRLEDGQGLVECETWAENQNGRKVMLGKSTAALPRRD